MNVFATEGLECTPGCVAQLPCSFQNFGISRTRGGVAEPASAGTPLGDVSRGSYVENGKNRLALFDAFPF